MSEVLRSANPPRAATPPAAHRPRASSSVSPRAVDKLRQMGQARPPPTALLSRPRRRPASPPSSSRVSGVGLFRPRSRGRAFFFSSANGFRRSRRARRASSAISSTAWCPVDPDARALRIAPPRARPARPRRRRPRTRGEGESAVFLRGDARAALGVPLEVFVHGHASFADALSLICARRSATSASSSRLARAEKCPGGCPSCSRRRRGRRRRRGEEAEKDGFGPEPGAGGEHGGEPAPSARGIPSPSRGADEVARETVGARIVSGGPKTPLRRQLAGAFPTSMAIARASRSAQRAAHLSPPPTFV